MCLKRILPLNNKVLVISVIFILISSTLVLMALFGSSNPNQYYDDYSLGKILYAHSLTDPMLNITGYFWNGNFILKGSLKNSDKPWNGHLEYLLKSTTVSNNTYNVIRSDTFTVYLLRVESLEDDEVTTYIYDYAINKGLHIFGEDYSLEDSRDLSIILLYGERMDYDIIKEEYPQTISFGSSDSDSVDDNSDSP